MHPPSFAAAGANCKGWRSPVAATDGRARMGPRPLGATRPAYKCGGLADRGVEREGDGGARGTEGVQARHLPCPGHICTPTRTTAPY
jgi:hypothetical protein